MLTELPERPRHLMPGKHRCPRTPLAFCEIHPPDHFPLLFHREPTAPDLTLEREEIPDEAVSEPAIFWVTATGLSEEPSRDATLNALERRGTEKTTVFDLDFRPELWRDTAEAGPLIRQALAQATVAVGNQVEVATAVGTRTPEDAAQALLDLGVQLAVVKLGHEGVLAATHEHRVRLPPVPVNVVNGLGAGDAFGRALCHGLLAGWTLAQTIGFANASGALVASRLGCADSMPTDDEVRDLLAVRGLAAPPRLPMREETSGCAR